MLISEGGWAVEYTPVNELLDYPFALNVKFDITDKNNKYYNKIWSGEHAWTVYDMYHAILDEISFLGTPDDQMRAIAELDQRFAEAMDAAAAENLRPIDELFNELRDMEQSG
jgi:hypothetical protein